MWMWAVEQRLQAAMGSAVTIASHSNTVADALATRPCPRATGPRPPPWRHGEAPNCPHQSDQRPRCARPRDRCSSPRLLLLPLLLASNRSLPSRMPTLELLARLARSRQALGRRVLPLFRVGG